MSLGNFFHNLCLNDFYFLLLLGSADSQENNRRIRRTTDLFLSGQGRLGVVACCGGCGGGRQIVDGRDCRLPHSHTTPGNNQAFMDGHFIVLYRVDTQELGQEKVLCFAVTQPNMIVRAIKKFQTHFRCHGPSLFYKYPFCK